MPALLSPLPQTKVPKQDHNQTPTATYLPTYPYHGEPELPGVQTARRLIQR